MYVESSSSRMVYAESSSSRIAEMSQIEGEVGGWKMFKSGRLVIICNRSGKSEIPKTPRGTQSRDHAPVASGDLSSMDHTDLPSMASAQRAGHDGDGTSVEPLEATETELL
jgi:hypothetical protein